MPAGGLALAASVAMAAVLLRLGGAEPELNTAAPVAQAVPAAPVAVAEAPVVTAPVAKASLAPAEAVDTASRELVIAAPSAPSTGTDPRRQLSSFLINHARYGGGYAMSGPLGYARVTAHTGETADQDKR